MLHRLFIGSVARASLSSQMHFYTAAHTTCSVSVVELLFLQEFSSLSRTLFISAFIESDS